MNRVVEILMNRDGIDRKTAESMIAETRDEIICADNLWDVDDIMRDYLGLEPDYLQDILSF